MLKEKESANREASHCKLQNQIHLDSKKALNKQTETENHEKKENSCIYNERFILS